MATPSSDDMYFVNGTNVDNTRRDLSHYQFTTNNQWLSNIWLYNYQGIASYRITTIDYLAQGNDHLDAFKKKTNFVSPQSEDNNARFLIENYFKAMHAEDKAVEAKVEGRVSVKK